MITFNSEAAPVGLGVGAPSRDRCNPSTRKEQKGSSIMTQHADTEQLINGVDGRWLGKRGIFRHQQPDVDQINFDDWPQGIASHTMVTAVADWVQPVVKCELIRWVDKHEVTYEARVGGLEDPAGICDAVAYSIDYLAALAKVANDVRYEWEIISGVYPDRTWSVW